MSQRRENLAKNLCRKYNSVLAGFVFVANYIHFTLIPRARMDRSLNDTRPLKPQLAMFGLRFYPILGELVYHTVTGA